MAMGIVNDSEFDSELDKLTIHERSESAEVITINRGRGNNPEVPNSLRKIIGEESSINGRESGLEIAKNFGISPSSVSAYTHGATSTSSYDERPNLNHITEAKDKVSKRARHKLLLALQHLTPEKLREAKARDLSGIAKDMSAVIRDMEPDVSPNNNGGMNKPTFIFYSPTFKKEETFDVIYAKE